MFKSLIMTLILLIFPVNIFADCPKDTDFVVANAAIWGSRWALVDNAKNYWKIISSQYFSPSESIFPPQSKLTVKIIINSADDAGMRRSKAICTYTLPDSSTLKVAVYREHPNSANVVLSSNFTLTDLYAPTNSEVYSCSHETTAANPAACHWEN